MRYLYGAGLIVLLGGVVMTTAGADIYRYQDAEGRTYLTDKPLDDDYRLVKRYRLPGTQKPRAGASLRQMMARRDQLTPLIEQVARDQRLRPELLHAVVRVESAYNHKAVSSKGAVGLMQLMPATARQYGVSDSEDPRQNLSGGARYLRYLLGLFEDDLSLALAAYNAGENAVIQYGRQIPPYPETQNYVRKVLAFLAQQQDRQQLSASLLQLR